MARFVEIINDVVTNVVVAASGSAQDTWMAVPDDSPVSIGWVVVNGALQAPTPPPAEQAEPDTTLGVAPDADTLAPLSGTLLPNIPLA